MGSAAGCTILIKTNQPNPAAPHWITVVGLRSTQLCACDIARYILSKFPIWCFMSNDMSYEIKIKWIDCDLKAFKISVAF